MPSSQPTAEIRCAAALSTNPDWEKAIDAVCNSAKRQLEARPDLAMLFVSHHYQDHFEQLAARVCERADTDRLLGCSAESVVGTACEVENKPAVSLWLARLQDVSVHLMHLTFEKATDGGTIVGWPDDLPDAWPSGAALLTMAEPFSFPTDYFLERLNEDQRNIPVIGGMASGASTPGQNRLFIGSRAVETGAVAALVHGPLRIRTVVSQGCRPIGKHFVITEAERNSIIQLGGKPALVRLKEVFDTLPTREQLLVQQGLHVGCVVNEYQDRFEQGDFLVRNVVGLDQENGAVVIGEYVRPGQTVQFHIRDETTADEDLCQILARVTAERESDTRGALLFTCNGRGTRLFKDAHHDAMAIRDACGEIPLAGFFAQGEMGPVGGLNFVHGYTASIALFEPAPMTGIK